MYGNKIRITSDGDITAITPNDNLLKRLDRSAYSLKIDQDDENDKIYTGTSNIMDIMTAENPNMAVITSETYVAGVDMRLPNTGKPCYINPNIYTEVGCRVKGINATIHLSGRVYRICYFDHNGCITEKQDITYGSAGTKVHSLDAISIPSGILVAEVLSTKAFENQLRLLLISDGKMSIQKTSHCKIPLVLASFHTPTILLCTTKEGILKLTLDSLDDGTITINKNILKLDVPDAKSWQRVHESVSIVGMSNGILVVDHENDIDDEVESDDSDS